MRPAFLYQRTNIDFVFPRGKIEHLFAQKGKFIRANFSLCANIEPLLVCPHKFRLSSGIGKFPCFPAVNLMNPRSWKCEIMLCTNIGKFDFRSAILDETFQTTSVERCTNCTDYDNRFRNILFHTFREKKIYYSNLRTIPRITWFSVSIKYQYITKIYCISKHNIKYFETFQRQISHNRTIFTCTYYSRA